MSVIQQEQTMTPFQFLWHYRYLIWHATLNDIKARYIGSILGIGWAFLYPLLFLSVYVVVFLIIFRFRLPNDAPPMDYVMIIFTGLIPWLGFNQAISTSLSSVVSNAGLLRNTSFPTPVLPVKTVLASTIAQIISLSLLLIGLLFSGHINLYWFFLPIAIGLQFLLTVGISWVMAVLNVYFRDLGQVVSLVLFMLLFVSPIAYLPEMVPHETLSLILRFNPIYYLIALYRIPLFYGQLPPLLDLTIILGLSLIAFWFGYRFFVRVRSYIVDYV